jgi:hypothetical protein
MADPVSTDRSQLRLLSALSGVAIWVFYLWRAAPTAYLLDSSELVNATWSLGISHPPGHPAFHLLSYLAGLVPLGPYPWRIHLFAATCTALAVSLLPLIADRLAVVSSRFALATVGSFTLLVGTSTALLLQSIRGEVYSLHFLVAIATLWLMVSVEQLSLRALMLCALVLGIGLLNHHYLTFFLFPAVLAWLLLARFGTRPLLAGVAASIGIGLSLVAGYAALLARGAARPHGSWAWPDSLQDLYWVVSAQAFQKTAAKVVTVDVMTGLIKVSELFMEQVGPLGLLLGAAGLVGLAVTKPRVGLPLSILVVFNVATQFIFDFDPWNPDVLGYFMVSVAALGLGAGWLLQQLAEGASRSNIVRLTAYGLLPLTALFWGIAEAADGRTRDLAEYRESEVFRDTVLRDAPPDSLWVTAYFETAFQTWYAQGPEDQRPDIVHLHRSFRTYPHYDAMIVASEPRLAPLLQADASVAALSIAGLSAWADRSAVRMEPDGLVSRGERQHLLADAGGLAWRTAVPTAEEREEAAAAALLAWETRFPTGSSLELQSSRNLIWWSIGYARFLQQTGDRSAAAGFAAMALERSPNDPDLLGLMRAITSGSGEPGN